MNHSNQLLAQQLMTQAQHAGFMIQLNHDTQALQIKAPKSNPHTQHWVTTLRQHKATLTDYLKHKRTQYVRTMKQLAGEDWQALQQQPEALAALYDLVIKQQQMKQGQVPNDYVELIQCQRCQVVPSFKDHNDARTVLGCPWCFYRPLDHNHLLNQWAQNVYGVSVNEMRDGLRPHYCWNLIRRDAQKIKQLAIETQNFKRSHYSYNAYNKSTKARIF